jgi:hypothetical protein
MAYDGDAKFLQVSRRQFRKNFTIDFVVAKCGLVLPEAKVPQPPADIHGRLNWVVAMMNQGKQGVQCERRSRIPLFACFG